MVKELTTKAFSNPAQDQNEGFFVFVFYFLLLPLIVLFQDCGTVVL